MLITQAQTAYSKTCVISFAPTFCLLAFGAILHQKSKSNETTPRLFLSLLFPKENIFISYVAVSLANNFAAKFWPQAVLA